MFHPDLLVSHSARFESLMDLTAFEFVKKSDGFSFYAGGYQISFAVSFGIVPISVSGVSKSISVLGSEIVIGLIPVRANLQF